ncbi:MAG: multi-sensor hybrid histidine kinase [Fibrobacteres bacterium]|nr:multi-sensor hybrid histidine kinase [Fibrobacterota bacterium]
MKKKPKSGSASVRERLEEAEQTLNAIRGGQVDAVIVAGSQGDEVRAIQSMGGLADFVFNQVQQGIFIVDGRCRILRANGPARALSPENPEMRAFPEAVCLRPIGNQAAAAGSPRPIIPEGWPSAGPRRFNLDVIHCKEGVEDAYYQLEATAIDLESGDFRGGMIALTDITSRKRADMQLAERNNQLLYHLQLTLSITDNTVEALVLTDADGVVVLHNPASEKLFSCKSEDITGKRLHDLFLLKSEGKDPNARTLPPDLLHPRRVENVPAFLIRRDGREIQVEYSLAPVYKGESWTGSVLMLRDVSELRRVEEALRASEEKQRQSQKMEAIGRLAGGIAHDFNNLLLAILGFTELSLASLSEADVIYDNLKEVKKAGERAASLTTQLLAYSRKQMMTPKTVGIGTIIADMEKLLRRVLGERIALTTSVPEEDPLIVVDPGQLQQVLLNLALNSRDAMANGGQLSIQVSRCKKSDAFPDGLIAGLGKEGEDSPPAGEYVVVEVIDSGHGMDEHVKSRLFEPFFTTKEFGKGSGLGLATAFGIIKQSGGYFQVFSEPGNGAMFRILLPLAGGIEYSWESVRPERITTAKGVETILLVEDEDLVISLLKTVLVRAGYRVLAAASGEEALALAREFDKRVDLVITDVVMDGMSGLETWEKVKPIHPEADIIFISGYTEDEVVKQGVSQDGIRFLSKPFTSKVLLERVRDILDERQANVRKQRIQA